MSAHAEPISQSTDVAEEAMCCLRFGQLVKAQAAFAQLLAETPDHPDWLSYYGKALIQGGRVEEGLQHCVKALQLDEQNVPAHCHAVLAYLRMNRLQDAARHCVRALQIDPTSVEAIACKANILALQGNVADAQKLFQQVIAVDDAIPEILINYASLLLKVGQVNQAVPLLQRAIPLKPYFTPPQLKLAAILREAGHKQQAIEIYRHAIAHDPVNLEAYYQLATTHMQEGEYAQAVSVYLQALELGGENAALLNNLAEAYRKNGSMLEAVASMHKAILLEPENAVLYANLGGLMVHECKPHDVIRACEKALQLQPDHIPAQQFLGDAYGLLSENDKAAALYRSILQRDKTRAKTYIELHTVLFDDANLEPAAEVLQQGITLSVTDPGMIFFLGYTRTLQRNQAEADKMLRMIDPASSTMQSLQYAMQQRNERTRFFSQIKPTLLYGLEHSREDGLILEFGVRNGLSITMIGNHVNAPVHGFDSFEGLPESWDEVGKGGYTTGSTLPDVPQNVQLHVGWFEETLPLFAQEHDGPVRYMNIDCDIYSSTKTIFEVFGERIGSGTVIVFDEYLMNRTWKEDEYKAFQEAVELYGWTYEYIALNLHTKQAVVKIL